MVDLFPDWLDRFVQELKDFLGDKTDKATASISAAIKKVDEAVSPIVDKVLKDLAPKIEAAKTTVEDLAAKASVELSLATETLKGFTEDVKAKVEDTLGIELEDVKDKLEKAKTSIGQGIDAGLAEVKATYELIEEKVTGAVSSGLETAWKAGGEILAKTAEFLSPVLEKMESALSLFPEAVKTGLGDLGDKVLDVVSAGGIKLLGMMADDMFKATPALNAQLAEVAKDSPELSEMLGYIRRNEGQLAGVMGMGLMSSAVSRGISAFLDQIFNPVAYSAGWLLRTTHLTPSELVQSIIRFKGDEARFRRDLHGWGFDSERVEDLKNLAQTVFNTGELGQLWLRGLLTDIELSDGLQRIGWKAEAVERVKALYLPIPGPADLVRMAVREAFTPEIAEKFGQYEDLPPAFLEHARKVGLSDFWAKAFWASHWDLPSPSMGFEMLHRGIITDEELKLLLRALDVMPFWREKLIGISYSPFTRVDIRRMYQGGFVSREDVKRNYLDLGYSEDRAEKLTLWTEKEYQPALSDASSKERDLTKAEIVSLYRSQLLDRETTASMLASLRYSEEEVGYILALADFQEAKEVRTIELENIKLSYQKGKWTENEVIDALGKLNLSDREMRNYMLKWEKSGPVSVKFPTRKELEAFVYAGYATVENYTAELLSAGYSRRWADVFTDILAKDVAKYGTAKAVTLGQAAPAEE